MSRRYSLLLAVLAILTVAPTFSARAQTGSYEVAACNYAEGANNSWVWATSDPSHPSHYAEHTNCPDRLGGSGGQIDQEGGLSTTDELGLSNGAPPNTAAGWTFTSPAGTTITGITYERYIGHIFDSSNYWSPALRADDAVISGESCLDTIENGESCFVGGPPGEGGKPSVITGLSAHKLELSIICEAHAEEECITGATEHKTWAAMYGAKVTINDPTPPTLSTPTGTLWKPGKANGYHQGTETVTTSAEDIGGGVKSITLTSDGVPVEKYDTPCDYTKPQPCPTSTGEQTLTLPTTIIPDGTHTLTLYATDAAGNQSAIASEQVTIDNTPPPPPIELSATPTQPGGSTFTLTWTNPPGQVAPITSATYQVCATTPETCTQPTNAPPTGPTTITVTGSGTWTVKLWLTDAAGNNDPANAAKTTLTVPPPATTGSDSSDRPPTPGGDTGESAQGSTHDLIGSTATGTGPAVHLSARLHRQDLIVRVSGPSTGPVHISYTAHLHGHRVASDARTVPLKHGRLTTVFKLGLRTAAHATITVSARLDHRRSITLVVRR